jgi:putative transposase
MVTADRKHKRPIAANLQRRNFSAEQPNPVWTTEITYIQTDEGWVFLAAMILRTAVGRARVRFF